MRLVFFEIRKLLSKKTFIALIVFCFSINLCSFYFVHKDYRDEMYISSKDYYQEIIDYYSVKTNEEAMEELEVKSQAYNIYSEIKMLLDGSDEYLLDANLQSLEVYRENSPEAFSMAVEMMESNEYDEAEHYFNNVLLMQYKYINSYKEFAGGMKERAAQQTEFAVFSDPDSYSYKNILKTAEAYNGLENIELSVGNDYSFVSAIKYGTTDYFLVAVICFMCAYLFRYEREKGLQNLLRTARKGKLNTALAKITAMVILIIIITVTMLLSVFMLSNLMFGKWDLGRTVQSLSDFRNCILPLSCDEFALLYILSKVFGMIFLSLLFAFFFVCFSNPVTAYTLPAGLVLAEYLLFTSLPYTESRSHLKYINIFYFLDGASFWGKYQNLNILGSPIEANKIVLCILALLLIALIVLVLFLYSTKVQTSSRGVLSKQIEKLRIKLSGVNGSVKVFGAEVYKYLISSKMAVLMLVLLIFAVASSIGVIQYRTTQKDVIAYRGYMTNLEGKLTPQKEEFIESVRKHFEDLYVRIEEISADENLSQSEKEIAVRSIESSIENKGAGFEIILEQYQRISQLRDKGVEPWFVDETIYGDLLSNPTREWRSMVMCLVLSVATVPFIFTFEYRNKMIDLLSSTRDGRRKLYSAKLSVAFTSTVFVFLSVNLPYVIRFLNSFGKNCMPAPVVCINTFENSGLDVSIGAALFLELLIYLLIVLMVTAMIVLISVYVKNLMLTMAFSLVLTVVPSLVLYKLPALRIGAIFEKNAVLKMVIITAFLLVLTIIFVVCSAVKFTGKKLREK